MEVIETVNWKKMYLRMVAASEDALEYLEQGQPFLAKKVLIEAENECEDMYVEAVKDEIT